MVRIQIDAGKINTSVRRPFREKIRECVMGDGTNLVGLHVIDPNIAHRMVQSGNKGDFQSVKGDSRIRRVTARIQGVDRILSVFS